MLGGSYVALCLDARRSTEDIDLIPVGGGAERRHLLYLSDDLGLPIEAVNSAADFFVERIKGWRDEIELLLTGAKGRIFRPTATLFLLLKARRLSPIDLTDCLTQIRSSREAGRALDAARVLRLLDELAPGEAELEKRRAILRDALGADISAS